MPADDVSDLKDVFDAINKLCETMKTSNYDDAPQDVEWSDGLVSPSEVDVRTADVHGWNVRSPDNCDERNVSDAESAVRSQFVSAEDLSIQRMETQRQKWRESQASLASSEVSGPKEDRWSDTQASPPSSEPAARWSECRVSPAAACEPGSELYYTASSDVSLVSEPELPERAPGAEPGPVLWGHVAAMRERFESMTRASTPGPDTLRCASPAPDPFRPVSPSPDLLR